MLTTDPLRRHLREATGAASAALDLGTHVLPGRVLGNGRYLCLITSAGTGAAWLDGIALTPWRGDRVEDRDGWQLYLRDSEDGAFRSLGAQPAARAAERYQVGGSAGSFALTRWDGALESRMEVWVDPALALEYRVVTVRNHGDRPRRIELTSYLEVALAAPRAHAAHPGFSKLFVQTEYDSATGIVAARRRPRGAEEKPAVMAQAFLDANAEEVETDRMRFLGRGRELSAPLALTGSHPLSGTVGSVLDPVFALRRTLTIAPGAEERLVLGLAAGADARQILMRARDRGPDSIEASRNAADLDASARWSALGATADPAGALDSILLGLLDAMPPDPTAGVGFHGALGALRRRLDLDPTVPIVLVESGAALPMVERAAAAQALASALGIPAQVVAIAEEPRNLGPALRSAVRFIPPSSLVADELEGLRALARVVLPVSPSALHSRPRIEPPKDGAAGDSARDGAERAIDRGSPWAGSEETLRCFNGHGGFSADGREYVVRMPRLEDGTLHLPPRPWVNVIANPDFGCIVSERGAGCTWSGNSREFRLTPWSDDAVRDPHDEAFYLRDQDDMSFWSALPGPTPGEGGYEMRHGFGYSRCRHASRDLALETRVFVAATSPLKVVRVRVTNTGERPRRLSLFSYQRLVLGALPETSGRTVFAGLDAAGGILHARNLESGEFTDLAYAAAIADPAAVVRFGTERVRFLGAGGSAAAPAVVREGGDLDGNVETRGDACFAIQVGFDLGPGETRECAFLLGTASDLDRARRRVARLRRPGALEAAFQSVEERWRSRIERVQVETGVEAFDLLLNGWLIYQTLSCRIWGRSAFYQSGGAFGFRDQLQDAAALVMLDPEVARQQILLHARHQFAEGDVLHWWHPPLSRGIRTRFVDDLLWLPLLTAHYVGCTGDRSVLETRVPYLSGPALEPGQDEILVTPEASDGGDLYQHCVRAIDRSLATGAHGLPLFGTGDWNDGMNRVGREGRGESVWMGFFLHTVLGDFAPLCEARGDHERARGYRERRERLGDAIEKHAWDGAWYRRGYYDDGTPLGSRHGEECQIDALAQAWAVISGAAPRLRAERAMDEVEWHLISDRDGMVRLLTPPFDRTPHDPGYIKGYVPGVRENGGQYTHAALWVVQALLELGRRDRAAQVFEMLSPVTRTMSAEEVRVYQAEPYVVAADVYGEPPHVGRAGWTWYTGSAGWMLRVGLESLLGVRVEHGLQLVVRPAIPDHWPGFRVRIRPLGGLGTYDVRVENPGREAGRVVQMFLDGTSVEVADGVGRIPLDPGGGDHQVRVVLGR